LAPQRERFHDHDGQTFGEAGEDHGAAGEDFLADLVIAHPSADADVLA